MLLFTDKEAKAQRMRLPYLPEPSSSEVPHLVLISGLLTTGPLPELVCFLLDHAESINSTSVECEM